MQNEWAGAQAFSSFDTYLAPFVKADNLNYKDVKQCIQSFVYRVNTPSRWGTQAPFSNITLDWTCLLYTSRPRPAPRQSRPGRCPAPAPPWGRSP